MFPKYLIQLNKIIHLAMCKLQLGTRILEVLFKQLKTMSLKKLIPGYSSKDVAYDNFFLCCLKYSLLVVNTGELVFNTKKWSLD